MKECLRCESQVTETTHRVNCDNNGDLWSCPNCQTRGRPLKGPDDDRSSKRHDMNLNKIKNGIVPEELRGN